MRSNAIVIRGTNAATVREQSTSVSSSKSPSLAHWRARQQGSAIVQVVWALAGLAVIIAAFLYMRTVTPSGIAFTTPYQAVLLTNGSAYFGKLQGYGTPRPILTDVYYIATQTNPDTKQTNSVLVKRGQELHKPDRMYINPSQILCVEPVGTDSKVAQLIAQQGGH